MEAFHKAYTETYGRAKAYQELHLMFTNAEATVVELTKQIKQPDKKYGIG